MEQEPIKIKRNAARCLIAGCAEWSQHKSGVCEGHRTYACVHCGSQFRVNNYDAFIAKRAICKTCKSAKARG